MSFTNRSTQNSFTTTSGQILAILVCAWLAFVTLMVILEQIGLNLRILAFLMLFLPLSIYATIGVITRSMQLDTFFIAGRQVPSIFNGMASAVIWAAGALFLGILSYMYTHGGNALAIMVGWSLGLVLFGILIAPYIRKMGAFTLADFLGTRFQNDAVRLISLCLVVISCFLFLSTQIHLASKMMTQLMEITRDTAVYIVLVSIFCSVALGGMRSATWTQTAQFIVLIIGFFAAAIFTSIDLYGTPVALVSYSQALLEIEQVEKQLLETYEGLSSLSSFDLSFLELASYLILGVCSTAILPQLASRTLSSQTVIATRRTCVWLLLYAVAFMLFVPVFVTFAKLMTYDSLLGVGLEELPPWVYQMGNKQVLQICGSFAVGLEAVQSSCGAVSGFAGNIELSHLNIEAEQFVLSLPQIVGLPYVFVYLLFAGILAANLAAAGALVLVLGNSLSHDLHFKVLNKKASMLKRVTTARFAILFMLIPAAWVSGYSFETLVEWSTYGLVMIAAGLFPPIVLSIWWSRCTAMGAITGLLVGGALPLVYGLCLYFFDVSDIAGLTTVTLSFFLVPLSFGAIVGVSLMGKEPHSSITDIVNYIRVPFGDPLVDKMDEIERAGLG